MDYVVLIIGSDINAYYMARCYHEYSGKKAYLLAKSMLLCTQHSSILNIFYDNSIWNEDGFLSAIYSFREKHLGKKILLISSNESYATFISKNKKKLLKDGFVFNYADIDILESFMMKEKFYKMYKDSCIDIPNTYYFDCEKDKELNYDLNFPVILKPSNVIMYNHISFEGKNKIYKIDNEKDLKEIVNRIKKSGYTDILVIQDFIPGDDSYLFDSVVYVNKNKQVKIMSFAQIGLQEHNKHMVGNAAVLINGYYQFGNIKEIEEKIKKFLEEIGYQGFCEFDLKYDYRDNKFKVLEINARQGRSSYYITALGYNLVKVLIDDLIYDKEMEYKFLDDKVLLSFVPKGVLKKYVVNDEFKKEALKLWKRGVVNPLYYKKDKNFKRYNYLIKKYFGYYKDYKNGYWKV